MTRVQTISYPGDLTQPPTLAMLFPSIIGTYHSTRAQEVLKEVDAMRQYQVSLDVMILSILDCRKKLRPDISSASTSQSLIGGCRESE